ncbi:MAG: metal ABC transporter substrate-binding protein [Thermoleophilia bacterium]
MRTTARRWIAGLLLVALSLAIAACGGSSDDAAPTAEPSAPADTPPAVGEPAPADGSAAGGPTIVVTYSVLGSLVSDLVGDAAQVQVLMPNGVDPHDWQPSAKDVEAVSKAALVVENGLGLEEGLEDAIHEAEAAGVPVFTATDHVELRTIGEGEIAEGHEDEHARGEAPLEGEAPAETGEVHGQEEHEGETGDAHAEEEHHDEHAVGADDPHIWTDPATMRAVMAALATELEQGLGLDLATRAAELDARLGELDAEVEEILSVVPADRRRLVTGHESMGYFARRYGFTLVGALIPSISSQAQASAAELAGLKETIEREGATTIFTEIGTPDQVAETIADETGARVVELPSHNLPDDGSYLTFMRDIATRVADGLAS